MSRPSFQFYHGDWATNAKLRFCTKDEKGHWMDILCLMADSDEFGILRRPLKDICEAVGGKMGSVRALVEKRVMKGADKGQRCAAFVYIPRSGRKDGEPVTLIAEQDGPIWYSSKMVRDDYIRSHAGASTRFSQRASEAPSQRNGEYTDQRRSEAPSRWRSDGSSTPSPSPSPTSVKSKGGPQAAPRSRPSPKKSLPDGFTVSERVKSWALEKGYDQLERHLEVFVSKARAKSYTYADWDEGFMGAIREDWARIRMNGTSQHRENPRAAAARSIGLGTSAPDEHEIIDGQATRV